MKPRRKLVLTRLTQDRAQRDADRLNANARSRRVRYVVRPYGEERHDRVWEVYKEAVQ